MLEWLVGMGIRRFSEPRIATLSCERIGVTLDHGDQLTATESAGERERTGVRAHRGDVGGLRPIGLLHACMALDERQSGRTTRAKSDGFVVVDVRTGTCASRRAQATEAALCETRRVSVC